MGSAVLVADQEEEMTKIQQWIEKYDASKESSILDTLDVHWVDGIPEI